MSGRGIALDDDFTQDGFNKFTGNVIKLCSFAGISATFSKNLSIINNSCDGKYTALRTQSTTGAACYYGLKTNGLQDSKVEENIFANDLVNSIFAFNPQTTSFSNNKLTPDCTNADPDGIGAIGAICIIATGSNGLIGNRIDNNYIKRQGTSGIIPGIMLQIGAVTAGHYDTSICGNSIFRFNGNSINIPSISTIKSERLKINNNNLSGADTTAGAVGIFANGVTFSEFLDNSIYSYVTGISENNGQSNFWSGKVDFCGQGFVHSSLDSDYLDLKFSRINGEAIFGAVATINLSDATNCTFTNVGVIKSGINGESTKRLLVKINGTDPAVSPPIGAFGAGDRIINTVHAIGSPKAWVTLDAGGWYSEGNL